MNNQNLNKRLRIAADQNIKEKEFWTGKLSGKSVKSFFPYDILNYNPDHNAAAGNHQFELCGLLFSRLAEISANSDHKLHIILLTTLILLLDRYTGNRDIMVCTPIYNTDNAGEFMNTILPVRYPVDNSAVIRELFKEIGKEVLDATKHQNYPVQLLLEQLTPGERDAYTGLPDVGLIVENIHNREHIRQVPLNIVFFFLRTGSEIRVNLEYHAGLYHEKTIEGIGSHFKNLLGEIAEDIGKKVSQVSMMTEADKERLVKELNSSWPQPEPGKSLYELFEKQVDRTPGQTSVVFKDTHFTFQMLQKISNGLALLLKNRGVTAGTVVGLEAGSAAETIIGVMAILNVGGTCLPLSTGLSSSQEKELLNEAGAGLLLSGNQNSPGIPGENIIHIDHRFLEQEHDVSQLSRENPDPAPAYIVRKREVPGNARLTAVQHQQIISFLARIKPVIYENDDEALSVALVSSLSVDEGLKHLLGALLDGHLLHIVPDEMRKNGMALAVFFNKYQIRIADASPFHIQRMTGHVSESGGSSSIPVTKFFIPGGYLPLPSLIRLLDCLKKDVPGITIVYGIPGDCTAAVVLDVTRETIGTLPPIPMGKPVPGFPIHIVDRAGQSLPVGVPGELCVAGETAARESMQRTGNIAQRLADSTIQFLGKIHQQVILKNVKVHLHAIGCQLLNHEDISEAVVLERPGAAESELNINSLCAYFVARKHIPVPQLQEYLAERLPRFLIPASSLQAEEIPLTDDHRVDTDALLSIGISPIKEYLAPSDPIEEKLVEIWADILEKDQNTISTDDFFFESGGQSLQAIMMSAKIHKEFDISIPIPDIFELANIKRIAAYIKKAVKTRYSSIEPAEEKEYYTLSSSQRRLHILQLMEPGSIGYNVPEIVQLQGKLDRERLEKSFKRLIERHETLRTSFEMEKNVPVQKINRQIDFSMEYWCLDKGDQENDEKKIIRNFIRPFDLSKAPLLRLGLIKKEETRHILIVDRHHIISDAASRRILLKELNLLYDGKELSPLRLQYKDYSEWQNSHKQEELLQKQTDYWLEQFSGDIPELNLPTDYPRPPIQDFAGKQMAFDIGKEDTGELKTIASQEGTTIFILILAIFNAFLSRICSQEDIIIGTPVVGRRHVDLENIIGIFINTLALRNFPKSQERFIQFLREVKTNTLNAFENQMYQFEDLVEKVTVKRDVSRNPIFDVMFSFIDSKSGAEEIQELKSRDLIIKPYSHEMGTSKFDLTFTAIETDEKLHFTVEYCKKLFRKETIIRFINYFKTMMLSVVENPEQKISGLDILSAKERKQILHDFNDTKTGYPESRLIHEILEKQAERIPGHTALVGPAGREDGAGSMVHMVHLTYSELNKWSNQLANQLSEKGVKSDTIVGIMVVRSIEMIVGILAILKAGGAYLPLDPGYPEERIKYTLRDSSTKLLLIQKRLAGKAVTQWETETIDLEDPGVYGEPAKISGKRNYSRCSRSLAYVIYTSGSTGRPKGVMIEHHSVLNRLSWMQKQFPIDTFDTLLQKTPFTFDVSVWELFWWAFIGAKLCLLTPGGEKDPTIIAEAIAINHISVLHFVPSMLRIFLEFVKDHIDLKKLSCLKRIIASGEELTVSLVEQVNHTLYQHNGTQLANLYGPTEATVDASWFECPTKQHFDRIPIGKPIDNIQLVVLDKYLHLQPIEVSGELGISGTGLGRGYLNRPQLTGEKFVVNPFKERERLYRTGDLARWLPDGNIEFLGRIDQQVKIRGFRIELGEIESKLVNHAMVKEAVVLDRENENSEKYLCAYVIPTDPPAPSDEFYTSELKDYLSQELPEYMVPAHFVWLEELSLTVNGKIDRRALPAPKTNSSGPGYVAPRNEVEEKLVAVFKEVLGVEGIGIDDNFFGKGWDSIKAVQISARFMKYLLKVEIRDLLLFPTIRQLAKYVKWLDRVTDQGIVQGEVELMPIVKWFFESNFTDKHHFNQSVMLQSKAKEGFDEAILVKAFTTIVEHHDALRMVFEEKEGRVYQENRGLTGKLFDLQTYQLENENDIENQIEKKSAEIQASIHLKEGPLMKLGLFKTTGTDYLFIAIHHLVMDGVSWRILLEDFAIAYQQIKKREKVRLQEKTDSYRYWAQRLKAYAESKEILKKLDYWKTVEKTGAERLPRDHEVPLEEKKNKNTALLSMRLSQQKTKTLLSEVNRPYNTEINDILLTALGLAVKQWCGISKVLINLEGHGREEIVENINISRTIGWFTSLYPVILDMSHSHDLSYHIKFVKEILRKIPNKGIDYGILKYLTPLDKKDGADFKIKPEISFNYLGHFGQEKKNNDSDPLFEFSAVKSGVNQSPELEQRFAIDINGMLVNNRLSMVFAYNYKEYEKNNIEKLVNYFKSNLIKIIHHCSQKKDKELTPSDVGNSSISIKTLQKIEEQVRHLGKDTEIRLVYLLSPMQKGILLHTLVAEDSEAYFEQGEFSIVGKIHRALLEESLNLLIERYDIFRTIFIYQGLDEPLQVVLKKQRLTFYFEDISDMGDNEQKIYFETFKRNSRLKGFNLSKGPLMNVSLLKRGDHLYWLVLEFHHTLMDGWCLRIIYKELVEIYLSLKNGRPMELEPPTQYVEFIRWLQKQDEEEGFKYWQEYLKDYRQQATLRRFARPVQGNKYKREEYNFFIQEALTADLEKIAKENQVTVNTVIETVWGILLQKYNYTDDVVFGVVVSGRPPEIKGIEQMVGLFINTVPVRIRNEGEETFSQLLKKIQQNEAISKSYEYLPLSNIQANSLFKRELIDHIMAFENYPQQEKTGDSSIEEKPEFSVENSTMFEQSNYDLNIVLTPGEKIYVKFHYNVLVYGTDLIERIVSHFLEIFKKVAENPHIKLKNIAISYELVMSTSSVLNEDKGDFGF